MLLGMLGASLLGNLLTGRGVNKKGKGAIATSQGRGIIRAGERIVRAGYRNKKKSKKTIKQIFDAASSLN